MTEQAKQAQQQGKPTEQTQPAISSASIAIVFIGVIALGALALFGWKQYGGRFSPVVQVSTISNVVYLDVGGIISAATRKFIEGSKKDTGKNDPTTSGKEFSHRLAALLDEYRRAGVMVLDKRYVVAAPDGHDITSEVAAKLELALEK